MSKFFVPTNDESIAERVTEAINDYWAENNLRPTTLYVGRQLYYILLGYPNVSFSAEENGKRMFMGLTIVVIDYDSLYLRVHA